MRINKYIMGGIISILIIFAGFLVSFNIEQKKDLSGEKNAAIMNELYTRCKYSCTNYLLAKDIEKKTNFNNLCQEDCYRKK